MRFSKGQYCNSTSLFGFQTRGVMGLPLHMHALKLATVSYQICAFLAALAWEMVGATHGTTGKGRSKSRGNTEARR